MVATVAVAVSEAAEPRYAAVVTTAFVGAGVVALAAGAAVPDGASGNALDPTKLALSVMDRQAAMDKADRSQDRPGPAVTVEQGAPDFWLLPVKVEFQITTLWEMRWGEFHYGIDLAAPYGTTVLRGARRHRHPGRVLRRVRQLRDR